MAKRNRNHATDHPPGNRVVLLGIDYTYYQVSEKEAMVIVKALTNAPAYQRNYKQADVGGPDFYLEDSRREIDLRIVTGTIGPKPYTPPPPKKVLSIERKPAMKLLPGGGS